MRTVAPEIKTVEQPVQLLDAQYDGFVGGVRRRFEPLGLQAFARTNIINEIGVLVSVFPEIP